MGKPRKKEPPKRYRIIAWGAAEYPDLDIEADEVPSDLRWKYPFWSVRLQYAIPASAFIEKDKK